ncbi:hypothetical protein FB45DRAFT_898091 [Roridomyces roridus]|uniref:Uncharacterized protein n=1 Tax=Roridomyces roridus TaxID=1738132 RepID=A0AAD7FV38_9AGAR|nr:hypothetical protein FB45DRAFT_898091 [Roridomyces roridus]
MSTKTKRALILPADQPPPLEKTIVNGRRTPTYALAWFCDPERLYRNLGRAEIEVTGEPWHLWDVVSNRYWRFEDNCGYGLSPIPHQTDDGNFYLVAMFNGAEANHLERIKDIANDPLIQGARIAMGVDGDPELEKTLKWHLWPPRVLHLKMEDVAAVQ